MSSQRGDIGKYIRRHRDVHDVKVEYIAPSKPIYLNSIFISIITHKIHMPTSMLPMIGLLRRSHSCSHWLYDRVYINLVGKFAMFVHSSHIIENMFMYITQ
jgi:hypothetical protein